MGIMGFLRAVLGIIVIVVYFFAHLLHSMFNSSVRVSGWLGSLSCCPLTWLKVVRIGAQLFAALQMAVYMSQSSAVVSFGLGVWHCCSSVTFVMIPRLSQK